MIQEEIDKLLECGFIYPVPCSEWVSPIVVVPKKNGKLRICQDFWKLNSVIQKDYFPLPFTDAILDGVVEHECYSFLDGFSGYNQVQIAREDRPLTTFTSEWEHLYIVSCLWIMQCSSHIPMGNDNCFSRLFTETY